MTTAIHLPFLERNVSAPHYLYQGLVSIPSFNSFSSWKLRCSTRISSVQWAINKMVVSRPTLYIVFDMQNIIFLHEIEISSLVQPGQSSRLGKNGHDIARRKIKTWSQSLCPMLKNIARTMSTADKRFPQISKSANKVWLLHCNIATISPCAKLNYKWLGHFCIMERFILVTSTQTLHAFPNSWWFHTILFEFNEGDAYKERSWIKVRQYTNFGV